MDEAPVGISISDPNQAGNPLIYVNDAFVAMTGYSREDILEENHSFLQGENTDPDTVARIREAIETEESISTELRCYRKDGAEFWDYLVVAPVKNDAGDVISHIQFHQDVTSRRQRQEQLEVLGRVLRHNLRNEMNVVRGYAESLQTATSGEPASFAGKIIETSDKLIDIAEKEREITDILRREPTFQEIQLYDSLRTIVSGVQSDFPDATVSLDCPEDVVVRATTQFDRAIEELVINAVVHNDSASPDVTVTVVQSGETVRIDIADDGPSIPKMERNVLVNEAEQTPLYHGGGLGLWLVNLIITRSDGIISVEENSPAGNIVSVRLPP